MVLLTGIMPTGHSSAISRATVPFAFVTASAGTIIPEPLMLKVVEMLLISPLVLNDSFLKPLSFPILNSSRAKTDRQLLHKSPVRNRRFIARVALVAAIISMSLSPYGLPTTLPANLLGFSPFVYISRPYHS